MTEQPENLTEIVEEVARKEFERQRSALLWEGMVWDDLPPLTKARFKSTLLSVVQDTLAAARSHQPNSVRVVPGDNPWVVLYWDDEASALAVQTLPSWRDAVQLRDRLKASGKLSQHWLLEDLRARRRLAPGRPASCGTCSTRRSATSDQHGATGQEGQASAPSCQVAPGPAGPGGSTAAPSTVLGVAGT